MNRRRSLLILLLGLLSGLFAVGGASKYLSAQNGGPSGPAAEMKSIVVAKANVAKGDRLKREHLDLVSWPASLAPPSALRKIADAENRVALANIITGEPLFGAKLAPVGAAPGLAAMVPSGMRAVTVRVNEIIGVAGYLVPGSQVDVLTTMNVSRFNGVSNTISKTVLQNVKILAVGGRDAAQKNKGGRVSVVTLLVNPGQAERLTLASTRGQILLSLRSNRDKEAIETPGITPPQLIYGSKANHVKPIKAPKDPQEADAEALRKGIKELYPTEPLAVRTLKDSFIISGVATRAEVKKVVGRLAASFAPRKVVNLITVPERLKPKARPKSLQAEAEALAKGIKEIFPKESLTVRTIKDTIVISGLTPRDEVRNFVSQFAKTLAPTKVINLVSVQRRPKPKVRRRPKPAPRPVKKVKAPEPPPPRPDGIEIIRGTKRSVEPATAGGPKTAAGKRGDARPTRRSGS